MEVLTPDCEIPVQISNTRGVRVTNLTIVNSTPTNKPPIMVSNCQAIQFTNVRIIALGAGMKPVEDTKTTDLKIDGLKLEE